MEAINTTKVIKEYIPKGATLTHTCIELLKYVEYDDIEYVEYKTYYTRGNYATKEDLINYIKKMPEDLEWFRTADGRYDAIDIRVFTKPKNADFYKRHFGM